MKISAAMIVLNGDHVLQQSLASIYDFVDEIVIAEGPVKFWQTRGIERSTDKTLEIIKSFHDPSNKIKLISSQYEEKNEQFTAALSLLSNNPNYLFQVEADEVWTEESLKNLKNLLQDRQPV
jgi:glycosyltransferase involved in cell wall biosynthesis